MKIAALSMLALILASVAVIFDEREKPDFYDKVFVFGSLAMLDGTGLAVCTLALVSLT